MARGCEVEDPFESVTCAVFAEMDAGAFTEQAVMEVCRIRRSPDGEVELVAFVDPSGAAKAHELEEAGWTRQPNGGR